MSGGSFGYVYMDAESASSVLSKIEEIEGIEKFLRAHGRHEAADEVLLYIKELETHRRRIEAAGKRIGPLLQATEWFASSDTGIEPVDKAYWALMGMSNQP